MKKLFIIGLIAASLTSCSTALYYWGSSLSGVSSYEKLSYGFYDRQTPESVCELVAMYENIINHPGGTRNCPPPGVCAEYGYLLLMPGTAETFEKYATPRQRKCFSTSAYASSFRTLGLEMLNKEMQLYPESVEFIKPLLKKF